MAGAAGQAVVNASMVAASAGKAWWWVAAHQSVNSAQSAAYPVIVVAASGRLVTADRCELAIYLAGSLHAKWHGLRTLVLGSCLSQVQNGTSTSPTGLRSSSNGCGSVLTACCSNR